MIRRFTEEIEKEICKLYFEDRLSANKLAEQFQCAYSTIQLSIKRNGFKLRSKSEAAKGKFGAKHNSWRGGRKRSGKGYIAIFTPNHPNADKEGRVLEHRLVMEKSLDRYLDKKERVHHINEIPSDNRIENLILFAGIKEHHAWHKRESVRMQIIRTQ